MNQVPLVTSSTILPLDSFWRAVLLYHDRPNIINRRLVAIKQHLFCEISFNCLSIRRITEIFTREALLYEIRKLPDLGTIPPEFIKNVTETYDKNVKLTESNWDLFFESHKGVFISVRTLLARHNNEKCVEIVIFDKAHNTATFFAVQEQDIKTLAPQFPYHIELTLDRNLRIVLNCFEDADTTSAEWLADKLFPKLLKWAENEVNTENIIQSLGLVEADQYCTLYNQLKLKYAQELSKIWKERANTNPKKYIFEDLAIATYLICWWNKNGVDNVNFVDCGCGNGLLVYILNQEGYPGRGLDIRSRKIWEVFSSKANLKVETVTPSSTFPEATWIIGNHSDELTPWIPVIALRSSPKTNFFVLPCCSYDFGGEKYIRMNIRVSQYQDYLQYVKNISIMCGFNTFVDKLRIPSTKRICLIGKRDFDESQFNEINNEVTHFIGSRLKSDFVARDPIEKVRNCTQLDKNLIKKIVSLVVEKLLTTENFIEKGNKELWNQGGTQTLADLSQIIPNEDLKLLKKECKGLKTLLKNHPYIFEITRTDISLRKPLTAVETSKYRKKPCWFYINHPQGCFLDDETCAYKHSL